MPSEDTEDALTLDISIEPREYVTSFKSIGFGATSFEDMEEQLPKLDLGNLGVVLVALSAFVTTIYLLIYGYFHVWEQALHVIVFLGLSLVVFFLEDIFSYERRGNALDYLYIGSSVAFLAISIIGTIYFFHEFDALLSRIGIWVEFDYYIGGAMLAATLEASRRAFGPLLVGIAVISILYAMFGYMVPGRFGHHGYDLYNVTEITVLRLDGIYGSIPQIGATWVAIFIVYAGLIRSYHGMEYIRSMAMTIAGRFRSGVPQIAIITSMIVGSITGSAAANTAATGSFTIPLMKDANIDKETAAALESVASSGGQMLPPVMGAAAFLMAEFLGVPYSQIIIWGLVPALLFYVILAFLVAMVSTRQDIIAPRLEITKGEVLKMLVVGGHFLLSFGVLLYALVGLQYDPLTAGVYGMLALIGMAYVTAVPYSTYKGKGLVASTATTTKKTAHGFIEGTRDMAPIMIILAPIAVIIDMITTTGLNQEISLLMSAWGGSLLVLLLLAAAMSILFGLGMPTVAAYTLVVIFVVPGLAEVGVSTNLTHFFVFYFAVISGITPPVAIVIVIAAKIGDASFLKTCLKAIPFALPGYIIPFAFVYNPALIEWNSTTPLLFLVTVVGILSISVGLFGYVFDKSISLPGRFAIVVVGVAAVFAPGLALKVGIASLLAVYLFVNSPYLDSGLLPGLASRS